MAYSDVITAPFPSATNPDSSHISLPITALPGVSTAEINVTTGSTRQFALGYCTALYNWYSGLADADKPTSMVVALKPSQVTSTTSSYVNKIKYSFVIDFYVDIVEASVASEA